MIVNKMLFIFNYPSGGVETLARQRSKALKPFNIQFDLLYSMEGPGLQNIKDTNIFIKSTDEEVKQLINEGNYDAIIVCSDFFMLEKIRGFGYTGMLIYEVQGLGPIENADYWLSTVAKPYIEQYATAILTPITPHLIKFSTDYYPSKPKFHFHNGLDTNLFKLNTDIPHETPPIVAWVGRIEKNKNWHEFILITKSLIRLHPQLRVWMFLDSIQHEEEEMVKFRKQLERKILSDNLTLMYDIPHDEMATYYSRIAQSFGFLCSTSITEGFGYAILEAMSCKCPVLTTNSDGISSFVHHNRTGKVYHLGHTAEALVHAKDLLGNHALRIQLTENAANYVQSNFSLEQYGHNFVQMINALKNNQA